MGIDLSKLRAKVYSLKEETFERNKKFFIPNREAMHTERLRILGDGYYITPGSSAPIKWTLPVLDYNDGREKRWVVGHSMVEKMLNTLRDSPRNIIFYEQDILITTIHKQQIPYYEHSFRLIKQESNHSSLKSYLIYICNI